MFTSEVARGREHGNGMLPFILLLLPYMLSPSLLLWFRARWPKNGHTPVTTLATASCWVDTMNKPLGILIFFNFLES